MSDVPGSKKPPIANCFPMSSNNFHRIFHTIKGVHKSGLLVDPGASRGLIGSDTLKDIIKDVLVPNNMQKFIVWQPSTAKFTGISDQENDSLGICTFPIGLQGVSTCFYTADVVGNNGSTCPGLIPLHSLMAFGSVLICNHYHNGDGVLLLKDPEDNKYKPQRVLLTDSGHYLLPIDYFKPGHFKGSNRITDKLKYIKDTVTKFHGKESPSLFVYPATHSVTTSTTPQVVKSETSSVFQ